MKLTTYAVRRDEAFDRNDFLRRKAELAHGPRIITSGPNRGEGVLLVDASSGRPFLSFVRPALDVGPLLDAVKSIKYPRSYRTDGLQSVSCTFGFQPRIPIRRDYCSTAALAYTNPEAHDVLISYGREAGALMREMHEAEFDAQVKTLNETIHPDWRDAGTHFTSGIVNKKNALVYHRDQGNVPESWSTMFTIARDMVGESGLLVIPEYRISLRFSGFEMLTFNGAETTHGVTPISTHGRESMRYSIVYYALKDMAKCLCRCDEVARIREKGTERSARRKSDNEAALLEELAAGRSPEEVAAASERKKRLFERTKRVIK